MEGASCSLSKPYSLQVIDTVPLGEVADDIFGYFEPLYQLIPDMPRPPETFLRRVTGQAPGWERHKSWVNCRRFRLKGLLSWRGAWGQRGPGDVPVRIPATAAEGVGGQRGPGDVPVRTPAIDRDGAGLRQSPWLMENSGLILLGGASLFPPASLGAVSVQVGKSRYRMEMLGLR